MKMIKTIGHFDQNLQRI